MLENGENLDVSPRQSPDVPMDFSKTIDDPMWLCLNEKKIKDVLPETWTHVSNVNGLQYGFKFKLLGLDWRSDQHFVEIMMKLYRKGLLQHNGPLLRRAP